ncbi:imelysin family protein [Amorphus coralli]|uniref:imelysin family protein n=1 Tax=Amorphus coralli TaxID=340680 RepID=UPI0004767EBE|nr:imelysin family protein [Amorphus coralli]
MAAGLAWPGPTSASDAPQFNRPIEAMLSGVVEGYIRPGYAALADAANALQAATVRYCANPSDTTRGAVDESFQRTVQALGAVAFLDFGPAGINRRLERLKTPVPSSDGGAAGEEPAPIAGQDGSKSGPEDVGALAQESPQIQGLPAFERLILAAPAEPGSDRFIESCRFAGLVAANVKAISTALDSDWAKDGGYGDWLATPAADNPAYRRADAALREVVGTFMRGVSAAEERLASMRPDADDGVSGPFDRQALVILYLRAEVRGLSQFMQATDLAEAAQAPASDLASAAGNAAAAAGEALAAIELDDGDDLEDDQLEQIAAAAGELEAARKAASDLLAGLDQGQDGGQDN